MQSGFLEEPAMLLAFVLLGRALEARARAKAAEDLRDLATLLPREARLVAADAATPESLLQADTLEVPTRALRQGDLVRVMPGERVPVDGEVLAGTSGEARRGSCRCWLGVSIFYASLPAPCDLTHAATDESLLTGEAALVAKRMGSTVTAGTVNYEGPIVVRATSTGQDSSLAGIGRLVSVGHRAASVAWPCYAHWPYLIAFLLISSARWPAPRAGRHRCSGRRTWWRAGSATASSPRPSPPLPSGLRWGAPLPQARLASRPGNGRVVMRDVA